MQENYYDAERRVWAAIRLSDWHRKLPSWMWATDIDSIGVGGTLEESFVEIGSSTGNPVAIIEYKHENWEFHLTVPIVALARLAAAAKLPFYVVRYHVSDNTFDIWHVVAEEHGGIEMSKSRLGFSAERYARFLAMLHDRALPDDFVAPSFDEYVPPSDRFLVLVDELAADLRIDRIDNPTWALTRLRLKLNGALVS